MDRASLSANKAVAGAPPYAARDRLLSRDRLTRHPQEGQHSAGAERGGTRDRVPPARDTSLCAKGSKPATETQRGSVHESPVRQQPHAQNQRFDRTQDRRS